jgi:hypothetical protein
VRITARGLHQPREICEREQPIPIAVKLPHYRGCFSHRDVAALQLKRLLQLVNTCGV